MQVEHYHFSPCAIEAIDEYYPKSTAEPTFSRGQRELQAELILCHLDEMDGVTRKRAMKTLSWIYAQ